MTKFLDETRTRLRLDDVVLDYVQIDNPSVNDDGEIIYSVTVLMDAENEYDIEMLNEMISKQDVFTGSKKSKRLLPLHDGIEKSNKAYFNTVYFTARTKFKPEVCDKKIKKISASKLYNGCRANVTVTAYAYDNMGKCGVSIGLGNIQFIGDGEVIEHGYTAEIDFAD